MNTSPPPAITDNRTPIVDAHVHLYDGSVNTHRFLDQKDETYEALVSGYQALPKKYLLDAYLKDTQSRRVEGIIWHEYLSENPIEEVKWGQRMSDTSPIPQAIVALVNFLDPRLEERLEIYRSLPNVTAVREHLGWDTTNPKKRMAKRPDFLTDPAWERGLAQLRQHEFKCGLEIFSPQIPDLLQVIRRHPHLGFTIAVMAWPLDVSRAGFDQWQKNLKQLSECENVCADVSAIECIFGMQWQREQVAPWILSLIEMFGPSRCMFGSNLPISKLSRSFDQVYDAHQEITARFSADEKDQMFRRVAADWFKIKPAR